MAPERAEHAVLLCCDVDRTVVPNGSAPEDPRARALFRRVTARSEIVLAYASGRSEELLREAISEYRIPVPSFAVGDVGSTIYVPENDTWRRLEGWHQRIAGDWGGRSRDEIETLIGDVPGLELQERSKQGRFKLSYYADLDRQREHYLKALRGPLRDASVDASISWSVDEAEGVGLVDILPSSATKHHAVQFLRAHLGIPTRRTVYAGDSGNDLPALTSGLQAVLVANARTEVREEAVEGATDAARLYLAGGNFHGLNGNYASGVLEGLAHFIPEADEWVRQAVEAT